MPLIRDIIASSQTCADGLEFPKVLLEFPTNSLFQKEYGKLLLEFPTKIGISKKCYWNFQQIVYSRKNRVRRSWNFQKIYWNFQKTLLEFSTNIFLQKKQGKMLLEQPVNRQFQKVVMVT